MLRSLIVRFEAESVAQRALRRANPWPIKPRPNKPSVQGLGTACGGGESSSSSPDTPEMAAASAPLPTILSSQSETLFIDSEHCYSAYVIVDADHDAKQKLVVDGSTVSLSLPDSSGDDPTEVEILWVYTSAAYGDVELLRATKQIMLSETDRQVRFAGADFDFLIDTDNDGYANLHELIAESNPLSISDIPQTEIAAIGTVSGYLQNPDGSPIVDGTVSLLGLGTQTDASGYFSIDHFVVADQADQIVMTVSGAQNMSASVTLTPIAVTDSVTRATSSGADTFSSSPFGAQFRIELALELPREAVTLSGQLSQFICASELTMEFLRYLDEAALNANPGAFVELIAKDYSGAIEEDGSFTFTGLPERSELRVHAPSYSFSFSENVTMTDPATVHTFTAAQRAVTLPRMIVVKPRTTDTVPPAILSIPGVTNPFDTTPRAPMSNPQYPAGLWSTREMSTVEVVFSEIVDANLAAEDVLIWNANTASYLSDPTLQMSNDCTRLSVGLPATLNAETDLFLEFSLLRSAFRDAAGNLLQDAKQSAFISPNLPAGESGNTISDIAFDRQSQDRLIVDLVVPATPAAGNAAFRSQTQNVADTVEISFE